MEIVSELVKKLINENAASPMNQDEYISRYDVYTVRFNKAKAEYEKLWNSVIDMVTVYEDERLMFKFKNGAEIEEQL